MEHSLFEQEINMVPWTIRQTFTGIFFTLVPWIVLALGLSSLQGTSRSNVILTPQQDLLNAFVSFIFASLIEGAFLIAPFYFANKAFRSVVSRWHLALQALGFKSFDVKQAVFWVVTLFLAIIVLNLVYQDIINIFHLHVQTNDQLILEQSKHAPLTTYATLIVSVVIAPLCEEVFFRGFVFPGFLRGMSLGWAIVLSALIFAIAHADPGSFAVLFCIGLALAFLRWYTRSLWPCILLHLLNNGVGALLIILVMLHLMPS